MSYDQEKADLLKQLTAAQQHIAQLEQEAKQEKEYTESLAADICKMEDALGFKNDCHDKDGAFVPTIGPWLERVRDLIAAEGELGDAKQRITQLEQRLAERVDAKYWQPLCDDLRSKLDQSEQRERGLRSMLSELKDLAPDFLDDETGHWSKAIEQALTPAQKEGGV